MKTPNLADAALATLVGLGVIWAARRVPVVGSAAGGLVPVAAGCMATYYLAMHRPSNGFVMPRLVGS